MFLISPTYEQSLVVPIINLIGTSFSIGNGLVRYESITRLAA